MGQRFMCTKNQEKPIWVKLDRFLVNCECLGNFPRVIQMTLPWLGSDHVAIRLEVGNHSSRLRPFRYEKVWSTTEGFHDLVKKWWAECTHRGCGAYILSKKIAGVKERLRQ